jgi:glycopeptide antibiotics resistance protein
MAKGEVRFIRVRKWVTFLLLLLVSAAIAAFFYSLSGRTFTRGDAAPFREVALVAGRLSHGRYSLSELLAIFAPALFNILLFLPWGVLMFLWVDRPGRRAWVSYLLTGAAGMAFALGLQVWQLYLPTRVTDLNDSLWNGFGALTGGLAGQLRRRLHVRFE